MDSIKVNDIVTLSASLMDPAPSSPILFHARSSDVRILLTCEQETHSREKIRGRLPGGVTNRLVKQSEFNTVDILVVDCEQSDVNVEPLQR
jgi:hypothetical protein